MLCSAREKLKTGFMNWGSNWLPLGNSKLTGQGSARGDLADGQKT